MPLNSPCSFIFRRPDGIQATARQYLELFERQGSASAQFINIYCIFYGGLLSLHYYRESQDQFWLDRAEHAIQKMEVWTAESVWNFENKLFLLQAERHYSFGNVKFVAALIDRAVNCYQTWGAEGKIVFTKEEERAKKKRRCAEGCKSKLSKEECAKRMCHRNARYDEACSHLLSQDLRISHSWHSKSSVKCHGCKYVWRWIWGINWMDVGRCAMLDYCGDWLAKKLIIIFQD
eukprot:scaffold8139_cov132-Skeletonema_dohrnii-CCMP3373.AAC.4